MKRQFYFGVVWLVVASGFDSDAFEGDELPCNYTDSINISKGRLDTNDSIIFRGMNFLPSRYAPKVHNGTILPTTRGCLCDQANCIRYCRADDVPDVGSKIEVINDNMKAEEIDLHGNFKIVRGIFCDKRIPSKYQMTPDGKVVPENDVFSSKRPRTQSEYCLRKVNENDKVTMIAEVCSQPDAPIDPQKFIRVGIGMLVSVPFLIATFLVYFIVPELRNLHGKCFLCYLLCLITAFVPLAIAKLNTGVEIPPTLCSIYAYTTYFSFISAFYWTSVISYDLWNCFTATVKNRFTSDKIPFCLYMLYGWGLSALMTLLAFSADHNDFAPEELKLKLGRETCFMTTEKIPRVLYFFVPLCFTFATNVVFLVLTAVKIRSVRHELSEAASYDGCAKQAASFKANTHSFAIYLRLVIVMGLNWIIEGVIVVIPKQVWGEFGIISQVLDMCNALMGVIIFGLFVLKPSVLRLLKRRWCVWFESSSPNGSITSVASWITPDHFGTDMKQR